MAETKVPPLIKLPPEIVQNLKEMEKTLASAKSALEALKSLGLDTKAFEEKVAWSEQARTTLLKNF